MVDSSRTPIGTSAARKGSRKIRLPTAIGQPPHQTKDLSELAFNPVVEIDRRIAVAPVQDVQALIRARGMIIQQDEYVRNGRHARASESRVFYSKVAFSIIAGAGGAGLIGFGFVLPGFFLLGSCAAVYVPDFVKGYFDQSKPEYRDDR